MDLSVIIVSWNVRQHLLRCLASLERELGQLEAEAEVLVIDNASGDGSAEAVESGFPWTRLVRSDHNRGFPAANNLGLARSSGDFVLFLNPDTEVRPGALGALLEFARRHPRAGVVGPQLLNPDGSVQSSRRRFPTLWTALLESTSLEYRWPANPGVRRLRMLDRPDDQAMRVDWVYGAAFLVRRATAEAVGPMDEGYFMYSEELDWCRRMVEAGWEVWYCAAARVVHHEGRSSTQALARRDILFHSAKVRYFQKFHGPWPARLLRAFLLADYAYRSLEEGTKWLLGHKRPLRASRLRAYAQVLRSGLSPGRAAAYAPQAPQTEVRAPAGHG